MSTTSNITKYNGVGLATDVFKLFDELHDSFWNEPSFQLNRNWRPTEISEDTEKFQIEIELPRFKRDEIKVEVVKGALKIVAKNNRSSYTRTFQLPYGNYEKAEVKLEYGVLTITVPKSDEGKSKFLEIK